MGRHGSSGYAAGSRAMRRLAKGLIIVLVLSLASGIFFRFSYQKILPLMDQYCNVIHYVDLSRWPKLEKIFDLNTYLPMDSYWGRRSLDRFTDSAEWRESEEDLQLLNLEEPPAVSDRYFSRNLTERQKHIMQKIINGLWYQREAIYGIHVESREELYEILNCIRLDYPELFWTVGDCVPEFKDGVLCDTVNLWPQYSHLGDQNQMWLERCRMQRLLENFTSSNMEKSDYEKTKLVYGYLIDRASLNEQAFGTTASELLLQCSGNSEGYARAAQLLLGALDVETIFVEGQEILSDESQVDHAWNIVNINGTYSHLDAAMGDEVLLDQENVIPWFSFKYLNTSGGEMLPTHHWQAWKYPTCTSQMNSYFVREEKQLGTISRDLVRDQVQKAVEEDTILEFQVTSPELLNEVYQKFLKPGILSSMYMEVTGKWKAFTYTVDPQFLVVRGEFQ